MNKKNNDFINSNLCLKDVLDKTSSELLEIPSKKIILNGERGTGRSLLLEDCEDLGIKNGEPFFATIFDSAGLFSKKSEKFDDKFIEHYYEIVFCNKLLNFINHYYPKLFEEHFLEINEKINSLIKDTDKYINDCIYTNIKLDIYLKKGDISSQIIDDFKYYSSLSTLSLGIDRFDRTNSSNQYVQELLSSYFDMFNKVILIVDDENLNDTKKQEDLLDKDFGLMQIEYTKNFEIAKEILKRRINFYNFEMNPSEEVFPFELIPDEVIKKLIEDTNGNITMMINVVYKCMKLWKWDKENFDIEKEFKLTTLQEFNTNMTLKRFIKPPKFYL